MIFHNRFQCFLQPEVVHTMITFSSFLRCFLRGVVCEKKFSSVSIQHRELAQEERKCLWSYVLLCYAVLKKIAKLFFPFVIFFLLVSSLMSWYCFCCYFQQIWWILKLKKLLRISTRVIKSQCLAIMCLCRKFHNNT